MIGYLAETGMSALDYLTLLATLAGQIHSEHRPVPGDLLADAGEQLPPRLADRAADAMAWRQSR